MNNTTRQLKHFLRIVIYTGSLYMLTHIVAFTILPLGLILSASGNMHTLQRLKLWFAKAVFWIVGQKTRVSGLEHIDPAARYLIVANYPSGYALFALLILFPSASFVAHEFIARIPLLGQFMRRNGTIFVAGSYPVRAYQAIDRALECGLPGDLIIMPEGGRSPDGALHPFKRGFAHILRHSNLDLLPITLNGYYHLKPANRIYLDPDTELEVLIHAPICNRRIKQMSETGLIGTVETMIEGPYRP